MQHILPFLLFGAMLLLIGGLIYYGKRWERQRIEGFQKIADEIGFEFQAAPDLDIVARFPGFQLFSTAGSKKVRNQIRGQASGLEVTIFDYSVTTGSGKNKSTTNQTVIAFEFASPDLPKFTLRPENVFHKIGKWFGFKDINFESHPGFSKAYLLQGEFEEEVRQIFTEQALEYYEDSPGVCTEGSGGRLLHYRASKRIAPTELRAMLEEGFQVLALFRPPGEKQ